MIPYVRLSLLLFVLAAGACAGRPAIATMTVSAPATAADYAPYLKGGTGTITGQAFLQTQGGGVVHGAGSPVTIDPATPYALEWYTKAGTDMKSWAYLPPDTLFDRAHRAATADAEGRFTVSGLPAGRYIVRSVVQWERPNPNALSGRSTEGGIVSAIVDVREGETTTAILNRMGVQH